MIGVREQFLLVIARVATTNLRWTDRLLWRLIAA
eukprot:CAMPEP_0196702734 /NCGR_PEP_ID=MMETSP1090-20130531/54315_1 /TAXON_ID=37098 /ORGANISM="Isochrysis sp, Strain CCMP1244" /LENGTH=33 /DNA_ID= /DNA_START= /DNA_END= /DNA_ORIENTATION=